MILIGIGRGINLTKNRKDNLTKGVEMIRIIVLMTVLLIFTGCKPSTGKGKKVVGTLPKDKVVAVVNGEEVLAGPVEEILTRRMMEYQRQTGEKFPAKKIEQARRQLIEQLINETVIMQAVNKSPVKVSESNINARISQTIEILGGEEAFEQFLKQSNYTIEKFRDDLVADVKASMMMEQQMGMPTATVSEAKEFYDEHSSEFILPESIDVSHILLKVDSESPISTQKMLKAELREIKEKIVNGKMTFEQAAEKYSQCPTAKSGGKIGQIFKADTTISPVFSKAAFELSVSNISDVVESEFGDHLIFVTQKAMVHTASFDEVTYKLIDYLADKKKRDLAEEWTVDLRTKADVKYK